MGLISWIIFGALVGWLGSKLAGTNSQQGWIINIVLGVAGAILGGFIWGWIDDEKFVIDWSIGSLILGVIGAFVLSWGFSFLTGRSSASQPAPTISRSSVTGGLPKDPGTTASGMAQGMSDAVRNKADQIGSPPGPGGPGSGGPDSGPGRP